MDNFIINETIGHLVSRKMTEKGIVKFQYINTDSGYFEKFLNDKFWANSIPIHLFRKMLNELEIDYYEARAAIIVSMDIWPTTNGNELWENTGAIGKYVRRLGEIMNEKKDDCSRHKKEFAGITDPKIAARMFVDTHYGWQTDFLNEVWRCYEDDAKKDYDGGRERLATALQYVGSAALELALRVEKVWLLCKKFMEKK